MQYAKSQFPFGIRGQSGEGVVIRIVIFSLWKYRQSAPFIMFPQI